jgi:outer membrane cobalamin receptor
MKPRCTGVLRPAILLFALLSPMDFAVAQQRPLPRPPAAGVQTTPDTLRHVPPDSTKGFVNDSTRALLPDSLVHYFLPSLPGSLNPRMDSPDAITDTSMEWISARTLNEVIAARAGIYGSDPSNAGQYYPLTIRGAGLRTNSVLVDGRSMADPASGMYNLSLFPVEMAERVEVVTGPRSFLYGTGSAGGTINIVTHTPSHRIPFTKIRYEEAAYDHTCSDGSFSQNLTRRTNLSAGYQYLGTGLRFYNSAHEQWNIRGALRYFLLPQVSMILSEHYGQTHSGLNGGINYLTTGFTYSFEPAWAEVYSTTAYEKLTRHDVDLRVIGMLLPDSTDLSTLNVYYSSNLREYRDQTTYGVTTFQQDQRSSWMGVRAQQSATLGWHHLSAALNCEMRQVEGSPTLGRLRSTSFSAWAIDEMELSDGLRVAAYGRAESYRGSQYAGIGGDIRMRLGASLTLRGGLSVADRAPSNAELYWADSTITRYDAIGTEQHALLEAGLEWVNQDLGSVRLSLAHRTITNPILVAPYDGRAPLPGVYLYNGDKVTSISTELAVQLRFFRYILMEGTGTFMLRRDGSGAWMSDYPRFWGEGGLYLAGSFFGDKLDLKAGVRSQIRTRHDGYFLSPQAVFAVPNTITPLGMASTMDLLAVARIGSAYVHIMWENVTSTRYFSSAFTPALERAVRFGISWEFLN